MKAFALIICLVALMARAALAEEPAMGAQERAACVKQAAAHLSLATIDAPVRTLVAAARAVYPDILQMIADDVPVPEYEAQLQALGPQLGCERIEKHVELISAQVPCYGAMEKDEDGLLDIARSSEPAKAAIEAYFACAFSKAD